MRDLIGVRGQLTALSLGRKEGPMYKAGPPRCLAVRNKAQAPQSGVLSLAHFQPRPLPPTLSSIFYPPSRLSLLGHPRPLSDVYPSPFLSFACLSTHVHGPPRSSVGPSLPQLDGPAPALASSGQAVLTRTEPVSEAQSCKTSSPVACN